MLDTNNAAMVFFAKAFLAFFCAVSLIAGVAFAIQADWVGIPITMFMVAVASLLWISFFPSHSEIHPGKQIGGGLRLARVRLEPGEVVMLSSMAGFAFGQRGVARMRRLTNNLTGDAFLTDRRLIFSPYRISMRFRPAWIALDDIDSISDSNASGWWYGYGYRRIVDVKAKDGSTCVFWLRDPDLLDQLRNAMQSGRDIPEATSNLASPEEPGLFAFTWGWGVTTGFIVMVLVTEGAAGFRLWPLRLVAAAMVSMATWNTLRTVVRRLKSRTKGGDAIPLRKS